MSDSLQPHESQHTRPPCPSPTPRVHSDSRPSSQWCHPAISYSVVPFSSCPQSFPASGSFQMSQLFASGGQSIGVSHHNLCWRKFPHFDWWYCQFSGNSKVMSKTSLRNRDWVSRSLKYQMIFSALWFSYSFHKVFSPLQTNRDARFGGKGRFYIFFVWESKWWCFPDFKPESMATAFTFFQFINSDSILCRDLNVNLYILTMHWKFQSKT